MASVNRGTMIIRADRNRTKENEDKSKSLSKSGSSLLLKKAKPKSSAQTDIKSQIEQTLKLSKETKQKLTKGLEFVKLIDNFNQQQRCLEHNNVITLYCLNQRKLLCVYCIYGVNKHRMHKLLPPLEHLEYIVNDVGELQGRFTEYLYELEEVIGSSKAATQLFQNIMKKSLSEIEINYVKKKLELQQAYEKEKKFVIKTCEEVIQKSQEIAVQYEQIKFSIWECQARYNLDKKFKTAAQDIKSNTKNYNKALLNTTFQNISNRQEKQNKLLKKDQTNALSSKKKQLNESKTKQFIKLQQANVPENQYDRDFRQILSKHLILNHIVEEMKNIQPVQIDPKTVEKKLLNKTVLKFVSQTDSVNTKSPTKEKGHSRKQLRTK